VDILLKAFQAADGITVRSTHQLGDQDRIIRVVEKPSGVEVHLGESPTKQIRLPLQRWKILCDLLPSIENAVGRLVAGIEEFQFREHLGKNQFVTVTSSVFCVDLRQFWVPQNETNLKPTKQGIGLRLPEFRALQQTLVSINSNIPELASVVPCREQHAGRQDLIMNCPECSPH
jgi:hypothetical protein